MGFAGTDDPLWIYFFIPAISGLVGWFTNVLAIYMTFSPIEFWPLKIWQPEGQPIGLIGWQGIIPAKAVIMTQMLCDLFVTKVLSVDEVFGRVDPHRVAKLTEAHMKSAVAQIADAVALRHYPDVWAAMSHEARMDLTAVLQADSVLFIARLLEALQQETMSILDLRALVGNVVREDKRVLNDIFLSVGHREFSVIRWSGLVFGLLFGIIQAGIYFFYQAKWVLPIASFLVGYITNWIALKLIFEPARPYNMGCYTIQGLFLKRQHEAAIEIARVTKTSFLVQERLWHEIFYGTRREAWHALLRRVTSGFLRERAAVDWMRRLAVSLLIGEAVMSDIRAQVADEIIEVMPGILPDTYTYMDEIMDIEKSMRVALQQMPPVDFINVLRPVFRQDEMKLIIVGGVLGAIAGIIQQFAIFGYLE